MIEIPNVKLNNGIEMPQLGLGVWQTREGKEVEDAVLAALEYGYRLIDTAAIYGNEMGVGRAIKASGLPRSDIFVTTKLWNADQGYDSTLQAFERSLRKLGTDYIDLYLIHWPMPRENKYMETWRAFQRLYDDGRVRAIGVSNFLPEHLETLLTQTTLIPAVNQIELHPYMQQHETRDICAEHDIAVESYSPIGSGSGLLDDPTIKEIATHYEGKTPAQIVLRWHVQNGLIVIPKSVRPERIRENADVFDFELSPEDMTTLASLNKDLRVGANPATAHFK